MKTIWTKGLIGEKKSEIESAFLASGNLRERLRTLIREKIDSNNTSVRSKENYENPSWAYLQADKIGYERALYEVISILEK